MCFCWLRFSELYPQEQISASGVALDLPCVTDLVELFRQPVSWRRRRDAAGHDWSPEQLQSDWAKTLGRLLR